MHLIPNTLVATFLIPGYLGIWGWKHKSFFDCWVSGAVVIDTVTFTGIGTIPIIWTLISSLSISDLQYEIKVHTPTLLVIILVQCKEGDSPVLKLVKFCSHYLLSLLHSLNLPQCYISRTFLQMIFFLRDATSEMPSVSMRRAYSPRQKLYPFRRTQLPPCFDRISLLSRVDYSSRNNNSC